MENYFYLNEKNEQKGPVSPEELIRNGVTKNYGKNFQAADNNRPP